MNTGRALPNPLSPLGRWLSRAMWWVEHAFERARASGKVEDDASLRIVFVLFVYLMAFGALAGFATRAAVFTHRILAPAQDATVIPRADLVDRNGQLLALDLVHYRLYVNAAELYDVPATRAALLAAIPNLSPRRLERALSGNATTFLVGGLTPDVRRRIHDQALPGIAFEEEQGRSYPLGETAAHVIGFSSSDGHGLAGAERAFDTDLRANNGQGQVALSIDLRVQSALQDELRQAATMHTAIGGAGIVVNVRTGEVLGMASWPYYDPNNISAASPDALRNRVANSVYEPGSVMKVFTLAMGLDAHIATVNTMFDARTPLALSGQTIHDDEHDNRMLPLWQVFTHSSNIGAARLGMQAGAPMMQRYFGSFGLLHAAPSELFESASPLVARQFTPNVVASMSFGHAIAVSPLQLATGMSSVLNGGVWRPLTLHRLAPGQAPAPGRRVISPDTSRTMLNLMRLNVTNGTGRRADQPGLRVGGKTGSAEKPSNGTYARNRLVSSFAAVFPTDGPLEADRYLVLIMLDEPHGTAETGGFATGGFTAAPAAGRVIARIAPFVGVRRIILPGDAAAGGHPPPVDPSQLAGEEER
jgi:cell division protein FtsI (penicillin-binding protein 3)